MPNVVAIRTDENGIELTCSNGRTFSLSTTQIAAHFAAQTGNVTTKKEKVRNILKTALVTAVDSSMIDPADIVFDFDPATGRPTNFGIVKANAQ